MLSCIFSLTGLFLFIEISFQQVPLSSSGPKDPKGPLGPDKDKRTCWKLVSPNKNGPVNEKIQDNIWINRMRNLHLQMTLWFTIYHKGYNICLKYSNLHGYSICPNGSNISHSIKWLFHCHSKQQHQLPHMWLFHLLHGYYISRWNVAIPSATVTITSAIHMWLSICHSQKNSINYLKHVVSISH